MYEGNPVAGTVAAAVTTAVIALPTTGGNTIVSLALSAGAGMIAWGALYALSRIS